MYFRLSFLLILIFFNSGVRAQISKYEPGYVVVTNDSISGFIQKTDEITLGEFIKFKKEIASSEIRQYYPQDITGFGFETDHLKFETVSVELRDDSVYHALRFGKIILKGYLKMYNVALPEQRTAISVSNTFHVFVIEKDSNHFTLSKYDYVTATQVETKNKYIGVLNYLLNDHPESIQKLKSLKFETTAIASLIENYNKFKNPESKTTQYTYNVKSIIKSGIETSFILTSPIDQNISHSKGFSVGYFWDIQKPDFSRKLSSRFGVNYMHLTYQLLEKARDVFHPDVVTTIKRHYLKFPLQGQLNFNNFKEDVCFFFDAGLTPVIAPSSNFKSIDIIPFMSIGAGVYLYKFKIAIQIDNDGLLVNDDKLIGLSLGYRFR